MPHAYHALGLPVGRAGKPSGRAEFNFKSNL